MAQTRTRLENKTRSWNANLRPRVTESVQYNGFYWSNLTGRNSEPGTGSDWVKAGAVSTGESNGLVRVPGYDGYLVDTRGAAETSRVLSGYILQGAGAYFDGEYVVVEAAVDDPAATADFYNPYVQSLKVDQ